VLEAACLGMEDMQRGVWMSCGTRYYQWDDRSWKWTATCSVMMTHGGGVSLAAGRTQTTPSHDQIGATHSLK